MHGILLAPSDAAVESLASSMGMSLQQLLTNPLLVDQITAYHFMLGVNITKGLKPANVPLITKTGGVATGNLTSLAVCSAWHAGWSLGISLPAG